MFIPVVLCGGSGTRLWPLSRRLYPKQFLQLSDDATLLQETVRRVSSIDGALPPIFVCNEEHRFLVAEQMRAMGSRPEAIILEPAAKNTAPAAAIAAMYALKIDPDAVLLVLPSDHVVRDVARFGETMRYGISYAQAGGLVTFGIVPNRPETGYGYIKCGEELEGAYDGLSRDQFDLRAYKVEAFVEKPGIELAQEYLKSGEYLWNSGIFLFRADTFLKELERHNVDMFEQCGKAMMELSADLDFLRVEKGAFLESPSGSIDETVMEKSSIGVVIPSDFGWSDVGSWSALWEVMERDNHGNVVVGDVLMHDTHDSCLFSSGRLIATSGLEGHVVVETSDAVLVARKDRVQDVKEVVRYLERENRKEAEQHRTVYRPWGSYEQLSQGERFQVKHIVVKPKCALSLQMHHHRAEHWIVVRGTAKIIKGDETFLLSENQSTYIPVGVPHRLENPGVIPLELIEVQSGSYLEEDDIVRLEDDYGRADGGGCDA